MKYYETLDVSRAANQEQIRNAYRILVQLHHPDRLQQVPATVRRYAEERLKKINEAYQVLGDPERRRRYDASLARSRSDPAYADGSTAYAEPYAPEDEGGWPARRRGRRRPPTAEQAAAQAAYTEWAHKEAEVYAQAREAERARQAERENRAAESRARRAAEEQYPRTHRTASGDEIVVNFAPGVWTSLLRVPAGSFLMGSSSNLDPDAANHEQPQHPVVLSEYFIGRYPVTNAQFQAFARAAPYALPARLPDGLDTHPVVNVTWDDAMALCQWLSRLTGRTFRLPSEAEWEKAARGSDGRRYPWGDQFEPARANSRPIAAQAPEANSGRLANGGSGASADQRGATTPVGRFAPAGNSPYGLADASGNVWEWCADWFDAKTYGRSQRHPLSDPLGPATGPGYVARGGAFDSFPKQLRCAHRNWFYPDDRRQNLGFRIVVIPF